MTNKYSHLPDIDLSSKDVYEYEGARVETPSQPQFTESGSKEIDSSQLNPRQSTQVFESSEIDASESDFSGKIDEKLPMAYKTRTTESLEARISRLNREIEEVNLEVERRGGKRQEDSAKAVKDLKDVLQKLSVSGDDKKLKFYTDLGTKSQKPLVAETSSITATSSLGTFTSLEERLHSLETKLGIVGPEQTRPIIPVLTYLRERINLLTASPATLDRAVNNLKTLTADTERLRKEVSLNVISVDPTIAATGDTNSSLTAYNHAHQINTIYNSIPLLKTVSEQIPLILRRLETLQTIHADASVVASTFRDFDATLKSLQQGIDQWRESLQTLETKIQEYQVKSDDNVKKVQDWVKELEDRL
jgi:nuclear migration protein JNM1